MSEERTRKIVINTCYGGFGLSDTAIKFMGITDEEMWVIFAIEEGSLRDYPNLVHAVEQLMDDANGDGADLKIVEIPYDVDWMITNYDGVEMIRERHRVWT